MDIFKKQNFSLTHPGQAFPSVAALSIDRMRSIRSSMARRLDLPDAVDGLNLALKLASRGQSLDQVDAEDPKFSLIRVLESHAVEAGESVLLNWYRFDALDEMKLADVDSFFTDLWYPGSDDLDIMDPSLAWAISIAHNGGVRLARL